MKTRIEMSEISKKFQNEEVFKKRETEKKLIVYDSNFFNEIVLLLLD